MAINPRWKSFVRGFFEEPGYLIIPRYSSWIPRQGLSKDDFVVTHGACLTNKGRHLGIGRLGRVWVRGILQKRLGRGTMKFSRNKRKHPRGYCVVNWAMMTIPRWFSPCWTPCFALNCAGALVKVRRRLTAVANCSFKPRSTNSSGLQWPRGIFAWYPSTPGWLNWRAPELGKMQMSSIACVYLVQGYEAIIILWILKLFTQNFPVIRKNSPQKLKT